MPFYAPTADASRVRSNQEHVPCIFEKSARTHCDATYCDTLLDASSFLPICTDPRSPLTLKIQNRLEFSQPFENSTLHPSTPSPVFTELACKGMAAAAGLKRQRRVLPCRCNAHQMFKSAQIEFGSDFSRGTKRTCMSWAIPGTRTPWFVITTRESRPDAAPRGKPAGAASSMETRRHPGCERNTPRSVDHTTRFRHQIRLRLGGRERLPPDGDFHRERIRIHTASPPVRASAFILEQRAKRPVEPAASGAQKRTPAECGHLRAAEFAPPHWMAGLPPRFRPSDPAGCGPQVLCGSDCSPAGRTRMRTAPWAPHRHFRRISGNVGGQSGKPQNVFAFPEHGCGIQRNTPFSGLIPQESGIGRTHEQTIAPGSQRPFPGRVLSRRHHRRKSGNGRLAVCGQKPYVARPAIGMNFIKACGDGHAIAGVYGIVVPEPREKPARVVGCQRPHAGNQRAAHLQLTERVK